MKNHPNNLLPFAALAILASGCAGYNHTLFMTKSNVGLDFDSKPPTAEVTISRKEAVIAPAFEGGQTPPVMASFKPSVGAGSSFFLGVDQTFAGGDAAVALAKLYNHPGKDGTNLTNFDSTLPLTVPPKHTGTGSWFKRNLFGALQPGETKPFIFGTDTMLGAKVAWTGTGGQLPDSLKAGFNRKEFAWAPITLTTNTTNQTLGVKMPAFLATIESSQIISNTPGLRIDALQYFATGEAATRLALQPEVRQAMLRRTDPNAAKQAAEYNRIKQNAESLANDLDAIIAAFDNARTDTDKQKIVDLAIAEQAVTPGTTREQFVSKLVEGADLTSDTSTRRLKSLRAKLP